MGRQQKKPTIKNRVKELRRVKVSELIPNKKNWRKHPGKQREVMQSVLDSIGFAGAMLARETDDGLVLLDGHLRHDMIDDDVEVPVLILDVNEKEADAILATYDPIGALAGSDGDALDELIESTSGLIGEIDTKSLLGKLSDVAADLGKPVEEPEIPELPKKPVTKVGDIWLLGEHRLVCGAVEEVAEQVFIKPWSLLVTDPPYGVSYVEKNVSVNDAMGHSHGVEHTDIGNDLGSDDEMFEFWKASFSVIKAFGLPGASYYTTGPQGGDLLFLFLLALRESEFPLRHMLVWAKHQLVFGRSDYHYQHEPIIYGWLDGAAHHKVDNRSETSLWQIDRPMVSKLHPTMKPVELYMRAMRNSSDPGDNVAEPFAGSGTAYIAAEQLGRVVYGCEIEPKYCDVIVERWQSLTGKKATRKKL